MNKSSAVKALNLKAATAQKKKYLLITEYFILKTVACFLFFLLGIINN